MVKEYTEKYWLFVRLGGTFKMEANKLYQELEALLLNAEATPPIDKKSVLQWNYIVLWRILDAWVSFLMM